ncbi:MAG TPA: hypothetical protein EYP98_20065 [Planctomycetes bacterium]|nr:hypothetical protein [Planctomycetota bacterium]
MPGTARQSQSSCSSTRAVFAIDCQSGKVVWRFGVGRTVWSSPTVVGDSLWFGSHDGLIRRLTSADAR